MKMGKKEPISSMSKSVKGQPLRNPGGWNPIKPASLAETPSVGHGVEVKRVTPPATDAVADEVSEA